MMKKTIIVGGALLLLIFTASHGFAEDIHGRYQKSSKKLKVNDSEAEYRKNELHHSWNKVKHKGEREPHCERGPKGERGPQGEQGPQGPPGPKGDTGDTRDVDICTLYNSIGNLSLPSYCNDICDGETHPWCSKIIFVTPPDYTGNLGGVAGADAICQDIADTAGLTGTFLAWIADSTEASSPAQRFIHNQGPYILVDGTVIADSWTDLTDGQLNSPIDLDSSGNLVAGTAEVWTNITRNAETAYQWRSYVCNDWTAESIGPSTRGFCGAKDKTDYEWTELWFRPCFTKLSLYCVQN